MNQAPAQGTPATPPPPPQPSVTPAASKKGLPGGIMAVVGLIVGIALGFVLFQVIGPKQKAANTPGSGMSSELTLPSDAVQIQSCADHKGKLYAKPNDIPVGPVYMVNQDKVIGIEFMLNKDQFLSGQSYKYLNGLGIMVDHVNIGLLSQGHEGLPTPHYHVDIYTVSKDVENAIACPGSAASTATPSASLSPSASNSATPSASR